MTILSRQVSVTTGAAIALDDGVALSIRSLYSLVVTNTDATNPVWLGPLGVTSGTGHKLPAGASMSIDLQWQDRLYAIATGGTVVVTALQSRFGNP